jgi:ribosomal protein S14
MTFKLRQFVHRARYSNRTPQRRSRQFLTNYLAHLRRQRPSGPIRASLGFLQVPREGRIAYRAACFLTGRRRGMIRRFALSRTCIKEIAGKGRLFGLRKSS